MANFPDGHKHILLSDDFDVNAVTSIKASLKSFDDIFLLAQAKQILPNLKYLYILYLLGARCDRRFSDGEAFDLEIVADVINSLKFEEVKILKPHSPVALQLIKNSTEVNITSAMISRCLYEERIGSNAAIVSPDKGASSWVGRHAFTFNLPLVQCDKQRSTTGHRSVSEIIVPKLPQGIDNYIIVDDLCDGGGTFIGVAEKLLEQGAKQVFLVVTHAIMSKGLDVFRGKIKNIYCTNSFASFNHPLIHQVRFNND